MKILSVLFGISFISRRFLCARSNKSETVMRYLNVAEKNDAAKNIASILSRGNSRRREGLSQYNKIYEFSAQVFGQQCDMAMTSVSGHLLNYEFSAAFRGWTSCNPLTLFDAPIFKTCPKDYDKIKKTLEREIRSCQGLIIWTDCDREGENIGFEIIKVCTDIKPDLRIYRAIFSEITGPSIFRAINNLAQPNKNVSDAVDVRQELDLRTGAAFTRLQTLHLKQVFPNKLADKLISYGSCQFPTLGFVVERYQAIENFISEPFWKIKMSHVVGDVTTDFLWKRERLFDKNSCQAILDHCKEQAKAKVESVDSKPKSKWRPLPLDTVEMEKGISRKLRINAKETMKIAEKLYTKGYISYPRTETNIFPKELNLATLVEQQTPDNRWGQFAQRILDEGGPTPRVGKKSDQAHPPIHPIKYANDLAGNDQKVYEYIVRHFLACVHKDAQGFETTVVVDIADEKFTAKGLIILEKNYLDVYVYEKWNANEINTYQIGDEFNPTILEIVESSTSPPKLLTEADLIALMEKHGIGTDATHADHIDTIKSREYVGLLDIYFVPGTLGMGLVEGYNDIGLEISLAKPTLRAEFEYDLKLICEGRKDPEVVRREQIAKYREVFRTVAEKMRLIDNTLSNRLGDRPQPVAEDNNVGINRNDFKSAMKCPKCGRDMYIRTKKDNSGKFLTCSGYPDCKNSVWFPSCVKTVEILDEKCPECGPNYSLLKITFSQNPFHGGDDTFCIGGCDNVVLETLNINPASVRSGLRNNTSTRNLNNIPISLNPSSSNTTQNSRNPPQNSTARVQNTFNINNQNPASSNNTQNSRNPPQNSTARVQNTFNYNNDRNPAPDNITQNSGNPPVCNCDEPAVELTVRKDGPNKGRQFYKCASNSCQFFAWGTSTDINPGTSGNRSDAPTFITRGDEADVPNCQCGENAVKRTVQKEGPNKGRQFYCCPKSVSDKCNFFKWADEVTTNNQNNSDDGDDFGGGGGGGGGNNWSFRGQAPSRGRGGKNRTAPYSTSRNGDGAKAKRKCGKCRQEGHAKPKCPN